MVNIIREGIVGNDILDYEMIGKKGRHNNICTSASTHSMCDVITIFMLHLAFVAVDIESTTSQIVTAYESIM